MSDVNGDIVDITFQHPTLGSGVLQAKANEDNSIDLGGFRVADDQNAITGQGTMLESVARSRASIECMVANDNSNREDLQKCVDIAGSPVPATWTFTFIGGSIYRITGKPVGDLAASINTGIFTLKVAGGSMQKIQ